MTELGPAQPWILLGLSLATMLASAKAHGRQIRLERELEGHYEVTFGQRTNPSMVEALWARDRRQYWATYTALGVPSLVYGLGAAWSGLPIPDVPGGHWASALAMALLLWAPTAAFSINGVTSLVLFRRAAAARGAALEAERGPWLRAARRGSWAWWSLVLIGGALLAFLAS